MPNEKQIENDPLWPKSGNGVIEKLFGISDDRPFRRTCELRGKVEGLFINRIPFEGETAYVIEDVVSLIKLYEDRLVDTLKRLDTASTLLKREYADEASSIDAFIKEQIKTLHL